MCRDTNVPDLGHIQLERGRKEGERGRKESEGGERERERGGGGGYA